MPEGVPDDVLEEMVYQYDWNQNVEPGLEANVDEEGMGGASYEDV